MPYKNNHELPESVKNHLPEHAQSIYRKAFNSAYEGYIDPDKRHDPGESVEVVSHKVAWDAVKKLYRKGDDGYWYFKNNT